MHLAADAEDNCQPTKKTLTSMNISAERRSKDLGIRLPHPPSPLGAHVESVQAGILLFLSGTLPVEDGVLRFARGAASRRRSEAYELRIVLCFRRSGRQYLAGPKDHYTPTRPLIPPAARSSRKAN
jgi:hypothetical protein